MRSLILSAFAVAALTGSALAQEAPQFVNVASTDKMASNLMGLDVYNGQQQDVGTIKDLVVKSDDTLSGYVLSVGGFLGMGTRYVIVAPQSVKIAFDSTNKKWRANISATADQLKSAPEFKYEGKADASKS